MAIHRDAAAAGTTRAPRRRQKTAGPVTLNGASPATLKAALLLAGGDKSRLKLARDRESVVILNNGRTSR